jgi:hypothetical protein
MKVIVKYVAFHPDNYQGGSGKSFEFYGIVEISDEIKVSEVKLFIEQQIYQQGLARSPWNQDFKVSIQSMEIV